MRNMRKNFPTDLVPITFIFDYYYVSDSSLRSSFTMTIGCGQGQGHNPKATAKADIFWPQANS